RRWYDRGRRCTLGARAVQTGGTKHGAVPPCMGYECRTSVSALGIGGATSGRSVPHHASHVALTPHAHGLNTLPPVPPTFNASPRRGTRCADRTALVCRRAPPPPAGGGASVLPYTPPAGVDLSPPQPQTAPPPPAGA